MRTWGRREEFQQRNSVGKLTADTNSVEQPDRPRRVRLGREPNKFAFRNFAKHVDIVKVPRSPAVKRST